MPTDSVLEFVHSGSSPERLDKLVREHAGDRVSREKIKKQIQLGLCLVDDAVCTNASHKVAPGRCIRIDIPPETSHLEPEEGDVRIIWQDEHLLVINKPAGLTVHPAPSCPHGTLIQRLLGLYPALRAHEGWRPGIVHRLDKDTSGLILVAPDEAARLHLSQAFARREVEKTYLALVNGVMRPADGACREPIGRDPIRKVKMAIVRENAGGRSAHTEWNTLYADPHGRFSLLAVRLHTGRTHQIRVHMAHLGHPLLGDALYAPKAVAELAPRQMLHAWKLRFRHPLTHAPCSFVCPPPDDMPATMRRLSRHVGKIVITGLPGCGKSRLTQLMAEEGYPTWSADTVVREAYEAGRDGWQLIHHRYRGRFTRKGQPVNKAALGAAIRETPGMREEIESLIHPLVNGSLAAFWDKADRAEHALAFAEIPLWFETGGSRNRPTPVPGKETVVGVHCPAAIRHDRLIRLRNWLPEMVAAADGWQWPEQKKMAACDHGVDNSGDLDQLLAGGRELLRKLLDVRAQEEEAHAAKWEHFWREGAGE